jgi:putative ABC transport system permease protein
VGRHIGSFSGHRGKMKQKNSLKPPRLAEKIFGRVFSDQGDFTTLGDLEEVYISILEEDGKGKARIWYWGQLIKSLLSYITNQFFWSVSMFKNYLNLSIRLMKKDKFHYFLNILGLSTGIACCIIIFLFLQNEITYDSHHEKADRIYRIGTNVITSGQPIKFALASPALGKLLKEEYPEIEDFVRVRTWRSAYFNVEEKSFFETDLAFTDPNYFNIFSHEFIYGNPDSCLNDPNTIVLTEKLSRKYFGDNNPLGNSIKINDQVLVKVTGVIKNLPQNSHVPSNGFISYTTYDPKQTGFNWPILEADGYTYLLVSENFTFENFYEKFPPFYDKYIAEAAKAYGQVYEPVFQKLPDIHYGPRLRLDHPIGNEAYLYAFFIIGIFILVLACINYMNLTTARAAGRAKEIGMKKVLGSGKRNLIFQILGESILLSFFSLLLGLGLILVFIQLFSLNETLGVNFKLDFLHNPFLFFGSLGLFLFMGLLSGFYPALYLSSILPVKAISGTFKSGKSGVYIRRILVTFQFIISIGVVIITLFMNDQIKFMRNKDLGFKKTNVVSIPIRGNTTAAKIPALLEELPANPDILSVTTGFNKPGEAGTGLYRLEGNQGMEEHNYYVFFVNFDYLKTLGIELIQGRDFDKNFPSDRTKSVIVNEKLVREMGWEDPIGKKVNQGNNFSAEVIGVVKDFNFHSLHNEIEPLLFRMIPSNFGQLIARIRGENIINALSFLESKWKEITPVRPFEYSFLDESFDRLYAADRRQNSLIKVFSYICILISLLGLLGLSSFTSLRKTKEVAIRKIHGASPARIILTLFREILFLIGIATIAAAPVSILFINMWLNNFAYRTGINILIFIVTGIAAVSVALITSSYHSVKVARSNPVDSLRFE